MQRLTGQLRVSEGIVFGLDMGAAFTAGAALGVSPFALAEWFPGLEAVIVRRLNEQAAESRERLMGDVDG